ncbi:hypothetical protein ACJJTC_007691 [Scirpophaga incertulas]
MIGVVILFVGLVLLSVMAYKNAYKRNSNFPPGPPSLPVYGAYWILLAHGYNNFAGAFKKLGEKYKTKLVGMKLGPFNLVVVNESALIKEMLNSEPLDGRVDFILGRLRSYWKSLGIFFTDGYFWHVQRRFSLRYMRDYGFGRRDEVLEQVVESEMKEIIDMTLHGPKYPIEEELVKGDLIYLPHYFAVPFINGILHVFTRMTVPRPQYHTLIELARNGLKFQRGSNDLGGALGITPWLKDVLPNFSGYNDLKNGTQYMLDFFLNLIKEAMDTHDPTHDRHFFDLYIKEMNREIHEKGKSTYSVDQLTLVCTDYMFPSATATTMLLTLLIERMLLQPEVQDRIHEEIDRVVGSGRLPNLDDRKNMPYTEACIREMMRHETLVPLGVPHRAMSDTKIAGYDIPENCVVNANYIMLHMDKDIWGDPENFRPERYIADGKLNVALDKSLPFGAGKRLCAGETYARQSMFQVFAAFMQAFHVSTADGKPLKKPACRIQGIITTIPEFWIRVTPRRTSSKTSN